MRSSKPYIIITICQLSSSQLSLPLWENIRISNEIMSKNRIDRHLIAVVYDIGVNPKMSSGHL